MTVACPDFIAAIDPGLCRAVDHYCERTSAAVDSEPINAATNAAFLVASWAAWRLASKHADTPGHGLTRALMLLIAVVGLGSFTFHVIGTRWAEWLDVIPILAFMLAYLWLLLSQFIGWPAWSTAIAVFTFFAATFCLEAAVPGSFLWGGAMYLPAVALMIVFGVVFFVRAGAAAGRAFAGTVVVFLASYATRSLDLAVCDALPIGTHFLWHVLNAVLLYLLVRVTVLHGRAVRFGEAKAS